LLPFGQMRVLAVVGLLMIIALSVFGLRLHLLNRE
jgi:hypothetical protein